ncbi:hypothetical protein Tco_1086930 [Tanacetum coccineum]
MNGEKRVYCSDMPWFTITPIERTKKRRIRTRVKVFSGVVEPINLTSVQKKPAAYKLPHAKIATTKEAEDRMKSEDFVPLFLFLSTQRKKGKGKRRAT